MTNLVPLLDNVLIEEIEPEKTAAGGRILLPDTAQEKTGRGRVLAVGPGKPDASGNVIPMRVRVGDLVVMPRYKGNEITIEGKTHVIFREEHLLAVFSEE